MPTPKTLLFICFITIPLSFATASPSAYEMLEEFGFPRGILPEGVQSYTLGADGRFEVLLRGDCDLQVEGGYPLKYRRRVTGRLDSMVLRELTGVSVKVLFVWVGISEVVRTTGSTLYFYVGPFSASFPVASFEDCPACRCGAAEADAAAAALSADS